MVDTPVKSQTWDGNSKEVVASVANWMLVECVASNTRWNSLTDGDGLVLRGMEMAGEIATHRGIPLGTVTLTPGELLTAMQDLAKASMAPTHPLPMQPVTDAQRANMTEAQLDAQASDAQRAGMTVVQWESLTDAERASRRAAFAPLIARQVDPLPGSPIEGNGAPGVTGVHREGLTDAQRAGLSDQEWNALTDEQRAESRRAHP